MALIRLLVAGSVVALLALAPVQAKTKSGRPPSSGANGEESSSIADRVLEDAIRLCGRVVNNDPAVLSQLRQEGWNPVVDREIGNAPYYKEISGKREYAGVGAAYIWGYMETYPGPSIGYCVVSMSDPEVRFSLAPINDPSRLRGETKTIGQEVYGTWQDSPNPSIFIHAYNNADTFSYQIMKILGR